MRCFECDDYLCETCVKAHKRNRHWKQHKLLTLDDFLSNKELQTIRDQNICSKHEGEILMFYCETCDVPICNKCADITHFHHDHKQAEIDEDSTYQRKKRIEDLENESNKVASKIDESISLTQELEQKLKASSTAAMSELDDVKLTVKTQLLDNLENSYKESKAAIQYAKNKQAISIKEKMTELKCRRNQLATSKKIAQDVIVKGSQLEIASVYSNITRSLTELCKIDTKHLPDLVGEMRVSFADINLKRDIGQLCIVEKKYDMKTCNQFGKLSSGTGISFTESERIVVSNDDLRECYSHVYSIDGGDQLFKIDNSCGNSNRRVRDHMASYPCCIVYSPKNGGQYFGTDKTQYVKVYSGEPAVYVNRFNVLSPSGTRSSTGSSRVQGLALDKDNNLIAGNVTNKYVSIMKTDGTHIKSMYVSIPPHFISATPADKIIVSSYDAVHVIDRTGKIMFSLDSPTDSLPKESWYPKGVCCSNGGAIFVAISMIRKMTHTTGIFQYSLSDGKYIGCCTKDVDNPCGIALSKDERKLAVADDTCVKIFEINESI